MLKFTERYLSAAEEYDAGVRSIEEKLRAEKATRDVWRHSGMPYRGVAQITLFATRNASAALTITYSEFHPHALANFKTRPSSSGE